MGPLLAGLDTMHYEAHRHHHSVHLHALYQLEELPHLIHISTGWLLRPAILVLHNLIDVASNGRMTLLHIKPPGIPPLQRGIQQHSNVLAHHPIMELQIYTTDHFGTAPALLLQLEQVSEEVEVGKNSKKRLTKLDENGDVQDGVGMQIAQAHSPILQQIAQERMNRNS